MGHFLLMQHIYARFVVRNNVIVQISTYVYRAFVTIYNLTLCIYIFV